MSTQNNKCDIPPTGWCCTRGKGHDGPCAAVPDNEPVTVNNNQFVAQVPPLSGVEYIVEGK